MASLNSDFIFLVLQFLNEENFKDTARRLEQESGIYFNMSYFEETVINGNLDDADSYISGFTKAADNRHSMKILFELRKQKYLEALDRNDRAKAVEILTKDLKLLSNSHEEIYKELAHLLTLDNFRQNQKLTAYVDAKSARKTMLDELKRVIEANPKFREKLQFPDVRNSRLRTLINQSLNWQHAKCKNPKPQADVKTLFVDHSCEESNGPDAPSPVSSSFMGDARRAANFPRIGPLAPTAEMESQTSDSERVTKRTRFTATSEASRLSINLWPGGHGTRISVPNPILPDDLPRNVVMTLNQGSAVKSMHFHPVHQTWLLVGTSKGVICIWDIAALKILVQRNFKVWDLGACSIALQASLAADFTISVSRVIWSSDGSFLGAAFSKNLVHIYSYQGEDLRNHLEIEAHAGSVNDIAFAYPDNHMSVITCGDDQLIKAWDANSGAGLFSCEGHGAPVYSVCPYKTEDILMILSASRDGKIKGWIYDNMASILEFSAPGCSMTMMALSDNAARLFSSGTSRERESYLAEWDAREGVIKRAYNGLGRGFETMVQFDTSKNQILAAGDESVIKFWDMNRIDMLATADANGGLPPSPCLRFSNEGIFLAVSTNNNGIKILANVDGMRLLHDMEDCMVVDVKPFIRNQPGNESRVRKQTEITEPSQCRALRLPDTDSETRIGRLMYLYAGTGIIALGSISNAVHKIWRWPRNERNEILKATTRVVPKLMQPQSGILMRNDISDTNDEDLSCFALSKNDSYLISASGGSISLFNLLSMKVMTKFKPPPPAATYLALHPQDNNIIAIGKDDSSIEIYNVGFDEVKAKLEGHKKRITGLAFSNVLNVLVSAAADSQLCVWMSTDPWERMESKYLEMAPGLAAKSDTDTRVQFHQDQKHLLVSHESQISIYCAEELVFLMQWVPATALGPIADTTYSCDSKLIYVSFKEGSLIVLAASTLMLRCQIHQTAYVPYAPSSYPVAIAAHPSEPNQFAVGLTDGGVVVVEPLESREWGTFLPAENDAGPSSSSVGVASSSQQPQPLR